MRCMCVLFIVASIASAQVATMEELPLAPNSNINSTPFTSSGIAFSSGAFEGFSYSNIKDLTTIGFTNQYAAYYTPQPIPFPQGAGAGGSDNYAVGYDPGAIGNAPTMTFPMDTRPTSLSITNTTYAYLSMRDGDPPPNAFAKKFGGTTGNDPDFLLLKIQGRDDANLPTGLVEFYLADYRFTNNTEDYLIRDWTTVDLSALSDSTRTLTFTFDSSDTTTVGTDTFINTPTYFAVDNIAFVPVSEPMMLVLAIVIVWIWMNGKILLQRH